MWFASQFSLHCKLNSSILLTERATQEPHSYHRARIRYFSTDVPSFATGTLNCAAKAAVFVNLYVEESISQSPPMGSFTCTVIGASLWLRNVISNSISQVCVSIRL